MTYIIIQPTPPPPFPDTSFLAETSHEHVKRPFVFAHDASLRFRKAVRSFGIACTWEEYMLFIYLFIYLFTPNVVCAIEHIL
jgi:hypothetical protein